MNPTDPLHTRNSPWGSLFHEGVIEVAVGAAFRRVPSGVETYLIQRYPSVIPMWSENWCYPGGKVKKEETPEEALIREWQEELAGTITLGPLLHVSLRSAVHPTKGGITYRIWTYLVEPTSVPMLQSEGGQAEAWVLISALRAGTQPMVLLPGVLPACDSYLALYPR